MLRFLRHSNSSGKRNTGCLDLYSDGAVLVEVIVETADIVTDGADILDSLHISIHRHNDMVLDSTRDTHRHPRFFGNRIIY